MNEVNSWLLNDNFDHDKGFVIENDIPIFKKSILYSTIEYLRAYNFARTAYMQINNGFDFYFFRCVN